MNSRSIGIISSRPAYITFAGSTGRATAAASAVLYLSRGEVDFALAAPVDREQLAVVAGMTPRVIGRWGEELLAAIDEAIALDRTERSKRSERSELQGRYDRLTAREREVLTFVVAGFANKQTASELGTSEITIGVHRGQIMRKMGARSLAELVRLADKLGVTPRKLPE